MPSHKVSLTNQGFRIVSDDFYIDLFALVVLGSLSLLSLFTVPEQILQFIFLAAVSGGFYFLYRQKVGYLYSVSFFSHILLFWLLCPPFARNWVSLAAATVISFGLLWKGNPFREIYFPFSLFIILVSIAVSLVFIEGFHFIFPLKSTGYLPWFADENLIPGSYQSGLCLSGPANYRYYSYLESLRAMLIFIPCLSLLRQYTKKLDFFLLLLFFASAAFIFRFDSALSQERAVTLSCIWFLLFSMPGKNYGFSYIYSGFSLIISTLLSMLLFHYYPELPPFIIVLNFFLCQSMFFVFVRQKNLKRMNRQKQ